MSGVVLSVDPALLARLAVAVGRQGEHLGAVPGVLAGPVELGEPALDEAVHTYVEALLAQAAALADGVEALADHLARAAILYATTQATAPASGAGDAG